MITSTIPINSLYGVIKAKVELYNGSTLAATCTCDNYLKDFTVSREGDSGKFFGFGICHKIDVNFIDLYRELTIAKGYIIKVAYVGNGQTVYPYPEFHVKEVTRDERNGTISVVAYDLIHVATEHTAAELNMTFPCTVKAYFIRCFYLLGFTSPAYHAAAETGLNITMEQGANLDGTETIREVLDAIAEVTQCIYYAGPNNNLMLKRLINGTAQASITRDDYIQLDTGEYITLGNICRTTELGNNITTNSGIEGMTQYIRNNPFYDAEGLTDEDVAALLETAIDEVGGLSMAQFTCSDWLGNILLEPSDKIEFTTEDGGTIFSYLLNDSITFDGTITEATEWNYTDNDAETESNPTNLGEALNQTFARVDKVNKEVELFVGDVSANKTSIAALTLNVGSISTSVSEVYDRTENIEDEISNAQSDIAKLQTDIKQTASEVKIAVSKELQEEGLATKGIKVEETGFTFDSTGLTIQERTTSTDSETGEEVETVSEMKTTISKDGMTVYRNDEERLIANNEGVKAVNLHATTFLQIGSGSLFKDYEAADGKKRTACFWIGG